MDYLLFYLVYHVNPSDDPLKSDKVWLGNDSKLSLAFKMLVNEEWDENQLWHNEITMIYQSKNPTIKRQRI